MHTFRIELRYFLDFWYAKWEKQNAEKLCDLFLKHNKSISLYLCSHNYIHSFTEFYAHEENVDYYDVPQGRG